MHRNIVLENQISYVFELVCINLNLQGLYSLRCYLVCIWWKGPIGHAGLHKSSNSPIIFSTPPRQHRSRAIILPERKQTEIDLENRLRSRLRNYSKKSTQKSTQKIRLRNSTRKSTQESTQEIDPKIDLEFRLKNHFRKLIAIQPPLPRVPDTWLNKSHPKDAPRCAWIWIKSSIPLGREDFPLFQLSIKDRHQLPFLTYGAQSSLNLRKWIFLRFCWGRLLFSRCFN